MSKHTPGPWKVVICDDGKKWSGWPLSINATNEDDKCVVRPGGQYPYEWDASMSQTEAVANANLIAAAPDMYDALVELMGIVQGLLDGDSVVHAIDSFTLQPARAAIAKATGSR